MRIVRTVLGEPTGTSIRFAQSAAAAIRRWAESNGAAVEVETVALEGEGKVADRVDMLWKLLEKWMNHVKSADFIVIGAHSQGVVVGLQLLARMIEQGWVDNARVGVGRYHFSSYENSTDLFCSCYGWNQPRAIYPSRSEYSHWFCERAV